MLAHEHDPIVVTVDQPPIGHDAALWSAALAERLHCPLRIVHIAAIEPSGAEIVQHSATGAPYSTPTAVVDDAVAVVHSRFPDLDVSGALIEEVDGKQIDPSTSHALATAGQDARIVVLGHPDAGNTDVLAATSRAGTLTEHTACPIVIWRGQQGQRPDQRPVILAVDHSADSAAAAMAAFEYADLFGAPLAAVHARPTPPAPEQDTGPGPGAEHDTLDDILSVPRRAFPDVAVTATVEPGSPRQVLTERAAGAQLVVIGTHGRRVPAVEGAESLSPYLFHHSQCPTMVCPPRPAPNEPDRTHEPGVHAGVMSASATDTAIPGVTTRILTVDDRDAVMHLHEQLSAADSHLRFFTPRPKHLGEFADQLCRQDYAHFALGAFEGDHLVGVANYVLTDTTPGNIGAEMALAVTGHEQRHGIGTQLVRHLGKAAYLHGVAHLTAEILAENTLMLAVITEQGWTGALRRDGVTVHFDLELASHRELHPQISEMPQDGISGRAIRKGRL
ncbi:GNAT family N-acetyltransferase [Rhodococcus qingshengii]|uniref:GNAT family N-acetyltransferase n=1 Tax=Rhodococcus qingshengii TaxID=334542 RepID=UPI0024BBA5AA|nr:GNAT family N-acetyltransferase [Rhodococcus qingshengii]MDJ0489688.1 GNAT family N-acetyltransferase [Rhodococcus qingshengii]